MKRGFTLIELLVVIAIIGLLSSIVLASLSTARKKARDAVRFSDIHQLQIALDLYFQTNGRYPDTDDLVSCGGWAVGNQSKPLLSGILNPTYLGAPLRDPTSTGNCGSYSYYRYPAGNAGCDPNRGAYYIIGVNFETYPGVVPSSPGFSCPSRNWQLEFQYVVGKYET